MRIELEQNTAMQLRGSQTLLRRCTKLSDVQPLVPPNKNVSVSTSGTQDLDEGTQMLS